MQIGTCGRNNRIVQRRNRRNRTHRATSVQRADLRIFASSLNPHRAVRIHVDIGEPTRWLCALIQQLADRRSKLLAQLLMQALNFDVLNFPTRPIHPYLRTIARMEAEEAAA